MNGVTTSGNDPFMSTVCVVFYPVNKLSFTRETVKRHVCHGSFSSKRHICYGSFSSTQYDK